MSRILQQISSDMTKAMKSGDKTLLTTLRLAKSELNKAKLDKNDDFNDEDAVAVLQREVKRRNEAAEVYAGAGRNDLEEKEIAEAKILKSYLPEELPTEEIDKLIAEVIKEVDATTARDIGRVMQSIMPKLKGRADGKVVKSLVEKALAS